MTDFELSIAVIVYSLVVVYGIIHVYKLEKRIRNEMKKYRKEAEQ